jgi:hypothetical protein
MFSSRRTLQCHCQDDEAWSHPAARNITGLSPGRQTPRAIMAAARVNQIAKNAAKCSEPDISIPFRTFDVRNRLSASICEG